MNKAETILAKITLVSRPVMHNDVPSADMHTVVLYRPLEPSPHGIVVYRYYPKGIKM